MQAARWASASETTLRKHATTVAYAWDSLYLQFNGLYLLIVV